MNKRVFVSAMASVVLMPALAQELPQVFRQGSFWLGTEQEAESTAQIQGKYRRAAAWIEGSNVINGKEYLMMWNGEIYYDEPDNMFEGERKGSLYTMLREEDGRVYSASLGGLDDTPEVLLYDFNILRDESVMVTLPRQYDTWLAYNRTVEELEAGCYRRGTVVSCGYEYPVIYLSGAYGESEGKEIAYWIGGIGSPDMPDGSSWNMSFLTLPYYSKPWECVYAGGEKVFDRNNAVATSQNYFREGTEWNVRVSTTDSVDRPGELVYGWQRFSIDGERKFSDTPDKTYLRIMQENVTEAAGYLRTEGEKVWYRGDKGEETLLYDFGVNPGDRLTVYDTRHYPLYFQCVSLGTMESCGVEYKVINLEQYEDEAYLKSMDDLGKVSWIQGIGSETGVLYPFSPNALTGAGFELMSVQSNGVTVYGNADASVERITTDLPGSGVKYDIGGRRVPGNAKGLYILNGRKYVGK
jgi:hypothetical protein